MQTKSIKNGKSVQKNYNFSDYTDLWSLVKKYLKKIINKGDKKTTKRYGKRIAELHNRLNPSGSGKRMNLNNKKILEDLYCDAKNLYIIREDIIKI